MRLGIAKAGLFIAALFQKFKDLGPRSETNAKGPFIPYYNPNTQNPAIKCAFTRSRNSGHLAGTLGGCLFVVQEQLFSHLFCPLSHAVDNLARSPKQLKPSVPFCP
jgi:hypothetical protein